MFGNNMRLTAVLDLDSNRFMTGIKQSQQQLRSFTHHVNGASSAVVGFNSVISMFAIGYVTKSVVEAGEEITAMTRRLDVLATSMRENNGIAVDGAESYNYLRDAALRTGQAFNTLAKSYMQLAPMAVSNGMALDDVRKALEGTIGAGQLMGATTEEMGRAFVAIRQVIGKDRLQMEELRGQLGEALPNSMLIMADGLTKLAKKDNEVAKSLGIVGDEAVVTTAKLNQMITAGLIDADIFVRAWQLGTEEFIQFANIASTTVHGQIQNMRTLFETNIGTMMMGSGLNVALAAGIAEFNDFFDEITTMSSDASVELGNNMVEAVFDLMRAFAELYDQTLGINSTLLWGLKSFIVAATESINGLLNAYPYLAELGAIGYLMFGKGGPMGLVRSLLMVNEFRGLATQFTTDGQREYIRELLKTKSISGQAAVWAGLMTEYDAQTADDIMSGSLVDRLNHTKQLLAMEEATLADLTAKRDSYDRNTRMVPWAKENAKVQEQVTVVESLRGMVDYFKGEVADLNRQRGSTDGLVGKINAMEAEYQQRRLDMLDQRDGARLARATVTKELPKDHPFAKFTGEQQKNLINWLNKDLGLLTTDPAGVDAERVLAAVEKEFRKFEAMDAGKVMDDDFARTYGMTRQEAMASKIVAGMKALTPNNMGSPTSIEELDAQHKARVAAHEKLMQKLLEVDNKYYEVGHMYRTELDEDHARIRERMVNSADAKRRGVEQRQRRAENLELSRLLSLEDMEKAAQTAWMLRHTNEGRYAYEALKEKTNITHNKADPKSAVYGLSEREQLALAIGGLTTDLDQQRHQVLLQTNALLDEQHVAMVRNMEAAQRHLELTKIQKAIEDAANVGRQQDVLEKQRKALIQEREVALADRLRALSDAGVQNELAATEAASERVGRKEQLASLERQIARASTMNLEDRQELLRLETQKLRLQALQNGITAGQMMTPEWQKGQFEVDKSKGQVEMAQLYYEYSMSAEQRLQLFKAQGVRNFTDEFTGGLMEIIEGQKKVGDSFRSVILDMSRMVQRFILNWMVQASMAGLFKMMGFTPSAPSASTTGAFSFDGPAFSLQQAHTGGIIGKSNLKMHSGVPIGAFANAAKYHGGGLVADEVPIVAKKGEGVFTPEQMNNADRLLNEALTYGKARTVFAPTINIEVTSNGAGGGEGGDEKLAETIGRRVRDELRGLVNEELRQQQRPGGMLNQGAF